MSEIKIKRAVLTVLICLFALPLFSLEFRIVPKDTIYKTHQADNWAPEMSLNYMKMITPGPTCLGMITEREDGVTYWHDNPDESLREDTVYEYFNFRENNDRATAYAKFVLAQQLQLFRISAGWFEFEALASGGINMIFEACGATDILGFDGFYFYGGAVRLFDRVSVRLGRHHYSGHTGDEVLESLLPDSQGRNYKDRMDLPDGTPGKIYQVEHYVRQDSFVAGVTVDVLPWLSVYFESDFLGPEIHSLRPWVLCPTQTSRRDDAEFEGEWIEQRIGTDEGNYDHDDPSNSRKNVYPDDYKDRILEFGAEAKIPAWNFGTLILAADFMFYEDGRTGHQIGAFSDTYGWTKDINLLVGFEIKDSGLTLKASYHSGRFPLTHFFFHECSYFSFGATYDI